MDVFREAVWLQVAGLVAIGDLPMIAADALVRGVDSPALRELAGLGSRDRSDEIITACQVAMVELGAVVPTAEEAVSWQMASLARRLLADQMGAFDVAKVMDRMGPGEAWMSESEFGFAHLSYYRDDFFGLESPSPEQRSTFEADLRNAAQAVVDEGKVVPGEPGFCDGQER